MPTSSPPSSSPPTTRTSSAPQPQPQPRAPAGRRAVVDVQGLVKAYGGTAVVDGLDLQVDRGEIFGLLGANGAGKTTTVECLQGLRRPDAGQVRVLGLDPCRDRARLRARIGSQLQDAALPDRLRVAEAVRLFDRSAASAGRSGRRRTAAVLERWGLAAKATTSFADLSGGLRQRLFIVLALLNDPEVVFLDELTQGLDAAARRDVWQLVRRIRDDGTTVVLVSHFADEIEALCDRVAVLLAGRVVDAGTPRQLVDRHAAATTIRFSQPVSFDVTCLSRLPGVAEVRRDGERVVVSGTTAMVAPVCAATLDERGGGPADLHVRYPGLDEALVHLIGAAA